MLNEMKKAIIITADGSHSVAIPDLNVSYHSKHGAIQESKHVFIEAGFRYCSGSLDRPDPVRIFEMGFGTGLNAFLTAIKGEGGYLIMSDGSNIDVSKTRKDDLIQKLQPFRS